MGNIHVSMKVSMVQKLGQNAELGKSDIKSAFRLIPVSPQDFDQLGFYFNGNYYFDKMSSIWLFNKLCNI